MACYGLDAKCSENVWYLSSPYLVLHFLLPFQLVPHDLARSVITTVLCIHLPYCSVSFCSAISFLFGRSCWCSATPQPLHCPAFHITCHLTALSFHFLIFLVQLEDPSKCEVVNNCCLRGAKVNSLAMVLQNVVALVQLPKLSEDMAVRCMSRTLRLSWYTPWS